MRAERRPTKHRLCSRDAQWWRIAGSREHDPDIGLTVVDTSVTHGLAVVGLIAASYKDELQFNACRLFQHGMCAQLDGGSRIKAAVVQGQALVEKPWPRHAVRNKRLID